MTGSTTRRGAGLVALAPLTLLAGLGQAAAPASAAQGTLAVSVEVVASCRVSSGPGDPGELVACGSAPRAVAAPSQAGASPAPARAGAPRTAGARIVVEPAAAGPGYLTVIW